MHPRDLHDALCYLFEFAPLEAACCLPEDLLQFATGHEVIKEPLEAEEPGHFGKWLFSLTVLMQRIVIGSILARFSVHFIDHRVIYRNLRDVESKGGEHERNRDVEKLKNTPDLSDSLHESIRSPDVPFVLLGQVEVEVHDHVRVGPLLPLNVLVVEGDVNEIMVNFVVVESEQIVLKLKLRLHNVEFIPYYCQVTGWHIVQEVLCVCIIHVLSYSQVYFPLPLQY